MTRTGGRGRDGLCELEEDGEAWPSRSKPRTARRLTQRMQTSARARWRRPRPTSHREARRGGALLTTPRGALARRPRAQMSTRTGDPSDAGRPGRGARPRAREVRRRQEAPRRVCSAATRANSRGAPSRAPSGRPAERACRPARRRCRARPGGPRARLWPSIGRPSSACIASACCVASPPCLNGNVVMSTAANLGPHIPSDPAITALKLGMKPSVL